MRRMKKGKIRTPWFYKTSFKMLDEDSIWFGICFYINKLDKYPKKKKINKFGRVSYRLKKFFTLLE